MNANEVLAAHWDNQLPVQPARIAQAMGIEVRAEFGIENGLCGCVELINGRPVIRYNMLDPEVRQRFTIAHEIGHYALGHLNEGTRLFRDGVSNYSSGAYVPVERDANAFAAALLMPAHILKYVVEQRQITDPSQLANLFNVSLAAMRFRLTNLNLT